MEKLKMESADLTEQNIDKIGALFPNVITETKDAEGNFKKTINFALLQQMLQTDLVDGDECYDFTWVGKKQSIIDGNKPIRKTLRPCVAESKDWDKTENLYIEGDNLEVLKLLQGSYLNAVKMIYIDPPYNTGKDFVYRDNFTASKNDYEGDLGMYNVDENRLFQNNESNGRFHSDWCSMMYPRLQLARNLLKDDGVIFISIDDNEVHNLRTICDNVFGEDNFVSQFIWKRRVSSAMADNNVSIDHEYVLCFQKGDLKGFRGFKKDFKRYSNPDNDPRGEWISDNLTVGMNASMRPNQAYDLVDPSTGKIYPYNPNRVWAFIPESMERMIEEKRIIFPEEITKRPMQKRFKNELKSSQNPFSSIMIDEVGLNTEATRMIQETMGANLFDYSKPMSLLTTIIEQINFLEHDIILDFFSGSATTAHAVMKINANDGGSRKYIMVQLPEVCDEKSEAFKIGYKNICDIGKERIRRAGKKIQAEAGLHGQNLDIGFRVLKLDSTNMKEVYYGAGEYSQQMLLDLESNLKHDRTDLDLLYGVLLDWGVSLALPHTTETLSGVSVHFVNGVDLVACFADNVNETVIRDIAKRKPLRVVFRDSSFANSPDKINVTEIFKTISPETTVKVI